MATHSDGILVSVSGVNTPETNGDALQETVKFLPANFYTDFLSDIARERKPSPSMFPVIPMYY
jgi:tryptophan aminotransferase